MEPADFRMIDLADDCLVPILRYLLAREGGEVRGPFGGHDSPKPLTAKTVMGIESLVARWRRTRTEPASAQEASEDRDAIDAMWAIVRSKGLDALRSQADARYPDAPRLVRQDSPRDE